MLPLGFDPALVTPEHLMAVAREAGIVIDDAVERAIKNFIQAFLSDPGRIEGVIATSTPPQEGKDGSIEWADELDPNGPQEVLEDQDQQANYYKGRDYAAVNVGDTVGTMHPPTEGIDGCDVLGRPLKGRPGKDISRKLDDSFSLHADGSVKADQEGVLIVLRGAPVITRLLKVRDSVDFSTGHIDFSGTVTIGGGIRSGFEVKAKGDIHIQGFIEVADLTCRGDLVARCGMAGKGKGRLTVGGDARMNYLEDARGTIEGDIRVQRGIVGCDLIVGKSVLSPTATLIGGKVAISGSLRIKALGSPGCTPTIVMLGDTSLLRAARREAALAISKGKAARQSLMEQQASMPLSASPTPRDMERLNSIKAQLAAIAGELETHRSAIDEFDQAIAGERTLDVYVGKIIHPNVTLLIGDTRAHFPSAVKGPIAICRDLDHQLAYRFGSGPARPLSGIAKLSPASDRKVA